MNRFSEKSTRKEALKTIVLLPAFAGMIAGATGIASAKGSQAQFKYQNTPKNGQQCSGCQFFIAGKSATANGACKIVDGSISPKGWCTAYSAKH